MAWGLIVVVAYLYHRLRRVEKDVRRLGLVWHDAAGKAMRRHRRDAWRWRKTAETLRDVEVMAAIPLDVPDLAAGPPDDPDSG